MYLHCNCFIKGFSIDHKYINQHDTQFFEIESNVNGTIFTSLKKEMLIVHVSPKVQYYWKNFVTSKNPF